MAIFSESRLFPQPASARPLTLVKIWIPRAPRATARSISSSDASTLLSGSEATQAGNLSGRASQIFFSSSFGDAGEIAGASNRLNRRVGEGQHLLIGRPLVHHADTSLDVVEHRDAGYTRLTMSPLPGANSRMRCITWL
jgi:hypothetical protein